MYRIKSKPEDFIVKEHSDIQILEKGEFIIFKLVKKDYTTEDAVSAIAKSLHIDRKNISYAGAKDRNAITEQKISIRGTDKERVAALHLKGITLIFEGYSEKPISLGDLLENSFEITVREIDNDSKPKKINKMVNYFGEQRFSKNNADIGKAIVKKDLSKAVQMLIENGFKESNEMALHLEKNKNDYVGALRKIPWKTLNLYIHAYQSRLWNKAAQEISEKENSGAEQKMIPIIGFSTEAKDEKIKQIIDRIMNEEETPYIDFIIRAIPDLSSPGTERGLYTEIKNLDIGELQDDDLNPGKKKCIVKFSLGKGSYATEAIKEIFS